MGDHDKLSAIQRYVAEQKRLQNDIFSASSLHRALKKSAENAANLNRYVHEQFAPSEIYSAKSLHDALQESAQDAANLNRYVHAQSAAYQVNAGHLGGDNFRRAIEASIAASEYMKEQALSYEVAMRHVMYSRRCVNLGLQNSDTPLPLKEATTSSGDADPSVAKVNDLKVQTLSGKITGDFGVSSTVTDALPKEPPVIWRAPGARLNDIAQIVLTDQAYKRHIMPILSEMWCAHHRAHNKGDVRGMRAAIGWGIWFLVRAAGPAILRTVIRWFGIRAG